MIRQFSFHDVVAIGSELRGFLHPDEEVGRPHPRGLPQRGLIEDRVTATHRCAGSSRTVVEAGTRATRQIGDRAPFLLELLPDPLFMRLAQAGQQVLRRIVPQGWLYRALEHGERQVCAMGAVEKGDEV
jgi:hypothetical protein